MPTFLWLIASVALFGLALWASTNIQPADKAQTARRVLSLVACVMISLWSVVVWRLATCATDVPHAFTFSALCG